MNSKFFYRLVKMVSIYSRKIINNTPIFFYLFRFFPIKKNKIVFCSFYGKGYCDNPKYICEEIIRQNLDYELIWLLHTDQILNHEIPLKVKIVKYETIQAVFHLVTAKIWIDNARKTLGVRKRKGQFYIQTWHGSLGIKKCEKDAEGFLPISYLKRAKNDSKHVDFFLSNGEFISRLYKTSFWATSEIIQTGSPRNDILLNKKSQDLRLKVNKYFNLSGGKKIALYAPTFRKSYRNDIYSLDFDRIGNALKRKFGGEWVFLFRLHPNIFYKANDFNYINNVFNATSYVDMQELLAATDILFTDYSSSMFDFSLQNKPCFLFAPDMEEFKKDRDFYFELEQLPFLLGRSNNEIEEAIMKFNEDTYLKALANFFRSVGVFEDGLASSRVVNQIKLLIS